MSKFLLYLAYQQFKAAKEHALINNLGRVDVLSFAAFAYSAEPYIDKDICVSYVWMFDHLEKVLWSHLPSHHLLCIKFI